MSKLHLFQKISLLEKSSHCKNPHVLRENHHQFLLLLLPLLKIRIHLSFCFHCLEFKNSACFNKRKQILNSAKLWSQSVQSTYHDLLQIYYASTQSNRIVRKYSMMLASKQEQMILFQLFLSDEITSECVLHVCVHACTQRNVCNSNFDEATYNPYSV